MKYGKACTRISGAFAMAAAFAACSGTADTDRQPIGAATRALGGDRDQGDQGDDGDRGDDGASWRQWAQNPRHTSFLNVAGQGLNRNLTNIVYDPLVDVENATGGGLLVHYQVPLVEDDNVFMEYKAGTFDTNPNTLFFNTQIWGETRFAWDDGQLKRKWDYASDWKAPGSLFDFWEPVFHAVLANGSVYVPGAGGTLIRLNKGNGSVKARINPFAGIDPNTYTVSPLTADRAGNLYYNVIQKPPGNDGFFFDSDVVDSWLVKVTPHDAVTKVSYSVLTPGAPAAGDLCPAGFNPKDPATPLPWPPSPTAVPPAFPCGTQRVAINVAPAIAPDGTLYSVTRAHLASRHGFLVAVNPDLTPKWTASLRERFHDGCGVPVSAGGSLPPNGAPGGCRVGANPGVDPATNGPGGGRVLDDASSTPTVAPDGSILYGAYSRYNYSQGHLMRFSSSGKFLGSFGFGWDSTPAIWKHGGTYSIVIKDNHYSGLGSYCDDNTLCPPDRSASNPASPEEFFVTQLGPSLQVEWKFKNTNTLACTRQPDGSVSCVNNHPHSFEWCVNAPTVDAHGVVYANSEDGNLYAIRQGGTLKQNIFQQLNLGAAYTPTSLGSDGKIYSQNDGRLFVVGN